MKTALITKLEELLSQDAGEVAPQVRSLQKEFQRIWTSEFEKAEQEFISGGGVAKDFVYHKSADDIQFEFLLERYNKQKKEAEAKLAAEHNKNLLIRQEIIAKIKDLSQVSENVGSAIRKLQELQSQWKETGAVSPHKYKEVQSDYSRAVEDIYYNIKIFRDLQEHDLRKNLEHKTAIIEKLKAVQKLENVKEAERLIKVYRNEWDEIGPVPNARWEALKGEYKAALDETYARIKSFYNSLEELKEENLKAKQDIISRAKALLEGVDEAKAQKWNDFTDKIIALQAEWKTVGRTSEKDNDKVWSEFRAVCDSFFEKKKTFFASLNEKFAAGKKSKTDLIAKAEALMNSTDWQKTGLELIKLQDAWKKYPSAGDKDEPKLFARFRKACNTFFDARKQHFESIDAEYEQNVVKKDEIISRLSDFKLLDDMQANREHLKKFTAEWNAAGLVPMKDKKRLNDAFYNKVDELYEQMNIDKAEKATIQFRSKLDRMAASENGYDLLSKESEHYRKLIDEINARVRTYDNNLGFFKSSKGKSDFLKEIEDKLAAEKSKLDDLSAKRKLINEELNKLRNAVKSKATA